MKRGPFKSNDTVNAKRKKAIRSASSVFDYQINGIPEILTHTQIISLINKGQMAKLKLACTLLENTQLLNLPTPRGTTPLMLALLKRNGLGMKTLMELLLAHGADPLITSEIGNQRIINAMNPLNYVSTVIADPATSPERREAYLKHLKTFKKYLPEKISDEVVANEISLGTMTPEENNSASENQMDISKKIATVSDVVLAVQNSLLKLKTILSNPANDVLLNKTNKQGKTPLMAALLIKKSMGSLMAIDMLLKAGADPTVKSKVNNDLRDCSPLDYVLKIINDPNTPPKRLINYKKYLDRFRFYENEISVASPLEIAPIQSTEYTNQHADIHFENSILLTDQGFLEQLLSMDLPELSTESCLSSAEFGSNEDFSYDLLSLSPNLLWRFDCQDEDHLGSTEGQTLSEGSNLNI